MVLPVAELLTRLQPVGAHRLTPCGHGDSILLWGVGWPYRDAVGRGVGFEGPLVEECPTCGAS